MSRPLLRDLSLLALLVGVSFFSFLGRTPVSRVQEVRVLEVAREMRERGDFVVPRFCGHERFQKPPLAYWLAHLGFSLRGEEDEVGGRLYSAFSGALTVLLVYAFGRSLGRPRLGLWAGMVLATTILFNRVSRHAETDGLLTVFTTAAFYAFFRLFETPPSDRARARGWALLAWGAMALGFLAKAPAGLLPIIPVAIYLGAARRWRGFALLFYPPAVLLFLTISVPWFLAVILREGVALDVFFRELQTVTEGLDHGKDSLLYALSFYLIRLGPDFAPWTLFLVPALWTAPRRLRSERGLGFLLAWAGGVFLQLQVVWNKQPHYFAAALPALALLTASWLEGEAVRMGPRASFWPARCVPGLAAAMAIGISVWAFFGAHSTSTGKACRDFALAARPVVAGSPVYFYNCELPELDFYLRRVVPPLASQAEVEGLLEEGRAFFLIARETLKDGSRGQDALLAADPRFLLVQAAGPREVPLRLYRTRANAPP